MFSFFGDFFSFGGGSRDDGHGQVPRGGDVVIDIQVTLEEVYNGNFIDVKERRDRIEDFYRFCSGCSCKTCR